MADSTPDPDTLDKCNVFVKYLPPDLTDDGLHALFRHFGDIISAKVMVDHISGNSLGYGYEISTNFTSAPS
jgi:RNA recognition motif-containing protein